MNAGQDNTMIAIHASALNEISGVLITLQDETIKRLSDATEAAEARAAQLLDDCEFKQSQIESRDSHIKQLTAKCDELERALRLLATDPITSGISAHYRATCSGAYRKSDARIDPLANALNILGIDS